MRRAVARDSQLSESQGECQALRQRVVELEAQLRTALTELELTSRRADVRAEALVSDKASLAERLSATEAASLLQRSDAQASSAQLGAALEHARARETVLESQGARERACGRQRGV